MGNARNLADLLSGGDSQLTAADIDDNSITADKLANTLEACINHYKACNLKEAKLRRQLKNIQETKRRLKKVMKKNLG